MRQLWEKAIEENNKNAMLNREQSELSRMQEYYGAYVIEAIQALSKDDDTEDKADNSAKHLDPATSDSGKKGNAKPPSANPTLESHE